jgi:hypothetical protein
LTGLVGDLTTSPGHQAPLVKRQVLKGLSHEVEKNAEPANNEICEREFFNFWLRGNLIEDFFLLIPTFLMLA